MLGAVAVAVVVLAGCATQGSTGEGAPPTPAARLQLASAEGPVTVDVPAAVAADHVTATRTLTQALEDLVPEAPLDAYREEVERCDGDGQRIVQQARVLLRGPGGAGDLVDGLRQRWAAADPQPLGDDGSWTFTIDGTTYDVIPVEGTGTVLVGFRTPCRSG